MSLTASDFMLVTAIAVGINASVVGPGIPIGVSWAEDTFMTISSSNTALLWAAEDEMTALQAKIDNGTATASDLQRMATLKERKRHLE